MNVFERAHAVHRFLRYRFKDDRHEMSFVRDHVAEGQTVIDIGAHKGAYTYWLSKAVGDTGRVFAFEPQAELVRYVEEVKADFRLSNVIVVPKALSSIDGEADLFQPIEHPLGGATLESFPNMAGSQVSVSVTRLDDFIDDEPRLQRPVSFIKADTQNHELAIFQGGERLLREDRPTLLFECMPPCWDALSSYLTSLGYNGDQVVVNRKRYMLNDPRWRNDFHQMLGNFLFVHESRQSHKLAA